MQKNPTVFEKEMDRKDFFRYVGSILLGIIGITHLVRTLSQHGLVKERSSKPSQSALGYGASPYGGVKR